MFSLDLSERYWWPVSFAVPSHDGGELVDMSFEGRFRRFTTTELDALNKRIVEERLSDAAIAREVMDGWRQVCTKAGEQPFTSEAFARMLEVPAAAAAINAAFYASHVEGLQKNLSRSPKHGHAAA